jgi:hypothetical protein
LGGLGSNTGSTSWASIDYLTPVPMAGGMGFRLGGSLF